MLTNITQVNPLMIKGSGYVVESLEAALWCFNRSNSFKDAILCAANLGDDTDTTAVVCGQLSGAYYGVSDIPTDWQNKIRLSLLHETLLNLYANN